jgi:glycosyltransferase involved in cell wall biosynthesis
VGRLTEIKNHELFLKVAARLRQISKFRVRFLIIGDGGRRAALEAQANALELHDDVMFLGTRTDPENFYPALDIVAVTSLNEGTPLSLIEAMANERAVIATAVGGVVDLLGPAVGSAETYQICERGVSIKSNDVESFTRGLARLIEDSPLRREVAARGRDFVAANYSKDRLLRDVSSLYVELTHSASLDEVAARPLGTIGRSKN